MCCWEDGLFSQREEIMSPIKCPNNIAYSNKNFLSNFCCKKLKWFRYRPGVAQRVGRVIALLFHDRGTRRGWVVSSTLRPPLPPGKTRYPLYRGLGGPQGRSGQADNLVPAWIRSRTVQPVVSRYTDWATGLAIFVVFKSNCNNNNKIWISRYSPADGRHYIAYETIWLYVSTWTKEEALVNISDAI